MLSRRTQNKQEKCNDNGGKILRVKPSIDHRNLGNAALIQMNKNIIQIILMLTKNRREQETQKNLKEATNHLKIN
jgi:hypothetical protein